MNGAPLDIFLSANQDFPKNSKIQLKELKEQDLLTQGKVTLFSTNKDFLI